MTRLVLCVLLCLPAAVTAQEVYRCEDANGQRVFSDLPCRQIGALPLPSERDPVPLPGPYEGLDGVPEGGEEHDAANLLPPPAAAGCPGPDPQQLGDALADAAMRSDLNAIAGMVYWPAAGRGAASGIFQRGRRLSERAPLRIDVVTPRADDSWLWAGLPPPEPTATIPELSVASAAAPDAELARFRLTSQAGCWWLLP